VALGALLKVGASIVDPCGAVLSGHPPQAPPLIALPHPFSRTAGDANSMRTRTATIFAEDPICHASDIVDWILQQ
jgi:hypothetical protein